MAPIQDQFLGGPTHFEVREIFEFIAVRKKKCFVLPFIIHHFNYVDYYCFIF